MSHPPRTLAQLVGSRLRALRTDAGVTADEVARAARASGLTSWHRSTVSTLEAGDRGLSAEELLVLPHVLELAGAGRRLTVADLLPADDERVRLADDATVSGRALRHLARGGRYDPVAEFDAPFTRDATAATAREPLDVTEAAASRHGLAVEVLNAIATKLWGHDFVTERERRIAAYLAANASDRSLQARRGHASRAMFGEVTEYVSTHSLGGLLGEREPDNG